MAISDKLNYLIETKQLFKDRLNSLGAEIIESTTFRNYLNWLDTFYNQSSDKTDLAKNGVVGRTSQNTAILPSEYTQVDYIESSGTQYIDTGFIPNQNTRTIIDFMPTYSSVSLFIFGSRLGYNNNAYDLYTFNNKFRDDYANTNYGNESSQSFPKSANKRYLFDKNKNHSSMYEDNVQFYDHTFTKQTINLSFNMFLFGLNDNGSIFSSGMTKIKLYSCKIYDNDILVRDFIPCYRNSDNVVGLYDITNDVFYTNQGTGAFTYGAVVSIPNPDYPQPINNLSGNVAYKITTQNGEQTFTIPLGDIELCNISDYKDRIYSQNGKFYLEKKTGKSILNGSENWLVGQYGTNSYNIKIANMKPSENNVTNPTYLIANLFKGVSYDDRTTGSNIAYSETTFSHTSLYIRNTNYTSITNFKAMLETTNLIVYYVLNTPTTTEITQENYPTLYSQLLAIQEFLTKYKINKEFLLDYSSPEIEY